MAIDRTGWPSGEWDDEPDEVRFQHGGYDCTVRRTDSGHLCGYVRVPEGHPLHGHDYHATAPDDCLKGRKYESSRTAIIPLFCASLAGPGRIGLDLALNVHGGITFAGSGKDWLGDGWWFGFDCMHADDLSPGMVASMRRCGIYYPEEGKTYRDVAYVRREVEGLADQIADWRWDVKAREPEASEAS